MAISIKTLSRLIKAGRIINRSALTEATNRGSSRRSDGASTYYIYAGPKKPQSHGYTDSEDPVRIDIKTPDGKVAESFVMAYNDDGYHEGIYDSDVQVGTNKLLASGKCDWWESDYDSVKIKLNGKTVLNMWTDGSRDEYYPTARVEGPKAVCDFFPDATTKVIA